MSEDTPKHSFDDIIGGTADTIPELVDPAKLPAPSTIDKQ